MMQNKSNEYYFSLFVGDFIPHFRIQDYSVIIDNWSHTDTKTFSVRSCILQEKLSSEGIKHNGERT